MGTINIVLFEPEIPQNTGNIMRTCVATNTILHLIRPFGFRLDNPHMKRSGVNYLPFLKYYDYDDWNDFLEKRINNNLNCEMYFLTRYGKYHIFDVHTKDVSKDYYLVLGKESTGIPKSILSNHLDHCIRLPMTDKVRALNVSNVAAIIIYEAWRQQGFPNMEEFEPDNTIPGFKGKDFLEE